METGMRLLAVLDTNVLVSALLKKNSTPDFIVKKAMRGDFIPILNDDILAEYNDVLYREKFNFNPDVVQNMVNKLTQEGIFLNSTEITEQVLDEKDVVFYAVTMKALNEEDLKDDVAYLVTGNIKHFPVQPYVVTPREFFGILMNFLITKDTEK